MTQKKSEDWSLASRKKAPSPVGTAIFVGLRSADVALQYSILQRGLGARLIEACGSRALQASTIAGNDVAGLTPYSTIISAMALGSAVKQIIYVLYISEQELLPGAAAAISVVNTVMNSANTLLSIWAFSSATPTLMSPAASVLDVVMSSPTVAVGVGLYTVGIITELYSELQRKAFKDKPENKGKPYGGGLWSLATNINYGGFTLWRSGYAVTAAGPAWGLAIGAFAFYDFTTRAIPALDDYCTEKVSLIFYFRMLDKSTRSNFERAVLINELGHMQYGESWLEIKKRVPYRLLPGIY